MFDIPKDDKCKLSEQMIEVNGALRRVSYRAKDLIEIAGKPEKASFLFLHETRKLSYEAEHFENSVKTEKEPPTATIDLKSWVFEGLSEMINRFSHLAFTDDLARDYFRSTLLQEYNMEFEKKGTLAKQ